MLKRTLLTAALSSQPAFAHHSGRHVTATVYASEFRGRITYCGQTYQRWGVSAAHPWLPCGTRSTGAAHRLGVPIDGIATVAINF